MKKTIKSITTTKTIATILSLLIFTVPIFVFSADATTIANPLKGVDSVTGFVALILGYVVRIGGVVAIFAFIWSGYLFVQAQGNSSKLEEARKVFINTCWGVAILLGAQVIASIIVGTLNSLTTK